MSTATATASLRRATTAPLWQNADQSDLDADFDGVPDACDICPGLDDNIDSDGDGIPEACDKLPHCGKRRPE